MPLLQTIQQPSGTIGLWKIDESLENLFNTAADMGFDITGQASFRSILKQRQWLAARCLVGSISSTVRNIFYDNSGAPHTSQGTHISFSHSYEMVGVILDKKADVGIDIQHFSPKIESIKQKFCSAEELNFMNDQDHFEKLHLIWCAKEAVYKQMKIPGLIFREQIKIQPFEFKKSGSMVVEVVRNNFSKTMVMSYKIMKDYALVYSSNP